MRFSIIMPVLNEEARLEQVLISLTRQCIKHEYELLIVDGGSTDDTVAIAELYGRVIHSSKGRATQMNMGAEAAQGDILLFLHADTLLPNTAFTAIERALIAPGVVAGCVQVAF